MITDWAVVLLQVAAALFIGCLCFSFLTLIPPPVTGDGIRIAARIRRTNMPRAEKIFSRFMRLEHKQHVEWAEYAYYLRLKKSDSERAWQFREANPDRDEAKWRRWDIEEAVRSWKVNGSG